MSAWLRNHPRILERAYRLTHAAIRFAAPLAERIGYERADRLLRTTEELPKKILFDCRMCGQCVLHETGMTCPMTCPKNIRNGPCGGVRADGHCEVLPEMRCIWVEAYERSLRMAFYGGDLIHVQPPVNRQLEGRSAWITMLTGDDQTQPPGWDFMENG